MPSDRDKAINTTVATLRRISTARVDRRCIQLPDSPSTASGCASLGISWRCIFFCDPVFISAYLPPLPHYRLRSISSRRFRNPVLGGFCQPCRVFLGPRFCIGTHNWLCARQAIANPRSIVEDKLQSVRPDNARDLAASQFRWIGLQLLSEFVFGIRGQVKILANWIIGTHFGKKRLKLLAKTLAAHGNHLRNQQSSENAIFLRNMAANRQSRALLAANGDFVLVDQLANVLESHWSFVELN